MSQFELLGTNEGKILKPTTLTSKKRESDTHPGIGFGISTDQANHVLSFFDGRLKAMLFTKNESTEGMSAKDRRQPLEGMDLTDLPDLSEIGRHIGLVNWKQTFAGYTLEIAQGAIEGSSIVLPDCEVTAFQFKLKQGGSVSMFFRIEAPNVDYLTNGRIQVLKDTKVNFVLRAPQPQDDGQQDIEQAAAAPAAAPAKSRRGSKGGDHQTPAQAFAAAMGQTIE